MFEQLKIQKQSLTNPPTTTSTNINKLQHYFESCSFLHQQQQLSVFIKQLPLINLKQIKSVNNLIGILIKQNQLLGQKCQQQVSLLKESYLKHEKIIKMGKQMKAEKEKSDRQKIEMSQQLNHLKINLEKDYLKKQEIQTKQRKQSSQITKYNILLMQSNDKLTKFQQLIITLCSEQYKKCEQLLKYNADIFNKNQHEIQSYCQNQRKKIKVDRKIKKIVQEFCVRLQKICKIVPPNVLADQLGSQTTAMMQLIDQISKPQKSKGKTKQSEGSIQKNISSMSSVQEIGYSSNKNIRFFQGMIQKLTQNTSVTNTTKQTLTKELEEVKVNLQSSKLQYQNILRNLKEEFVKKQEQIYKKLLLKDQTIKLYEEENENTRLAISNLKQENSSLNLNILSYKNQIQTKYLEIKTLQQKNDKLIQQYTQQSQRTKKESEKRIQELNKVSNMKVEQREEIINDLNNRRKNEQKDYQSQISQLKIKIKLGQEQLERKQQQLKTNYKSFNSLEEQYQKIINLNKQKQSEVVKCRQEIAYYEENIQKKDKQIYEFKETLNAIEREKLLQSSYITELQAKIQTLSNKIKNLQSKAKNDVSSKKQLTAMKNAVVQEKQKNQQYESYCTQMKEQNIRLKTIVKQMKKELEDVYVRLGELKQIETQRERLILQAQNSGQNSQNLGKEHEQLKFEMLKLEAENKKMNLELKHFKNIVNRIQFTQQD